MRLLLLSALTSVTLLSGALTAPASSADRGGSGYESRAVTRIQAERAARGLDQLRTSEARSKCLDRFAQRWSGRPGKLRLSRAIRECRVASVSGFSFVSSSGPARQVTSMLGGQTGRNLLTSQRRTALGFGHTKVRRGHSVVILLAPLRTDSAGEADQAKTDIVTATNAERTAHGLHALTADTCLMAAAQRHAEHLAAIGRLEHQDLGAVEATCDTRGLTGENVLYNPVGTGAHAVAQWMASDAHRATLLDPAFGLVGTGVAHDPATGMYYMVQVFAGSR